MFGRRVRRPGGARMPVIVVTGFLGAGKTTLIRALLDSPEGAGTAIIVNEFGEIGIDQALLRPGSDETILLGNGCLCCRMASDLQQTCTQLLQDRARGTVPSFARIVVETSGLADPTPILQTFISERALREDFHLCGLVAVVDAANFDATVERYAECLRQAELADRIVLSKSDLVTPEALTHVRSRLHAINPYARIGIAADVRLKPNFLLEFDAAPARFIPMQQLPHTSGIESFAIEIDAPLQWTGFSQALNTLIALRGPDLLRIKGLVNVHGCPGPVVLHLVQHLAHPPVELTAWPTDDRRTRIVCIVRNMSADTVRNIIVAVQEAVR